ncbi:MAG: glycosyltransferase [Candidatus Altiarchaeales archaeon]|nr:glycosyltransferase [Candidatus Altiarchaeales archaeon]MBD3417287.1 glycosyltransferase [Candidatus Altiarchaeales archaeon]
MRLVVVVPAYDEEGTVGEVVSSIPRDACDDVIVVVVDDGSSDRTFEEAEKAGADRIVRFKRNRGLAKVFKEGLDTALEMGADIVLNIDADGQYDSGEIPKLIKPILDGRADIVLGSRFKGTIEYMPLQKRLGNRIATWATNIASGYPVSDAQTGFRALTRDAVQRINIGSDYTYVQETIIQAVYKDLAIVEVPVTFRKRGDDSRLIPNIYVYAKKAGSTIIRTYLQYHPLKAMLSIGGFLMFLGVLAGLRVLAHYLSYGYVGYIPTALLSTFMLLLGFQVVILGILADLIDNNRRLHEELLYRAKKRG